MRTTFLLLAAAALGVQVPAAPPAPTQSDPLSSRTKGRADAPVTIYEMSDFQCPWCRRFALETFPQLEREYLATGKARLIYINYPVTENHPNAGVAAEAALCAARQGRFWPMHDLLFQRQDAWGGLADPIPFFVGLAEPAGLRRAPFATCLRNHATRAEVEADRQAALRARAPGTPSFYIEGGIIRGAQPITAFRAVLDSIYEAKTSRRKASR